MANKVRALQLGAAAVMLAGLGVILGDLLRSANQGASSTATFGASGQTAPPPAATARPTQPTRGAPAGPGHQGANPPPRSGGDRVGPSGNGRVFTQAPPPNATLGDGPCADCDIILITVCSLRKDFVGVYGELDTSPTPAMDSLAAGGWSFDRAYAAGNFTLAGLTAVLTGRFGSSTGVITWDKGLTMAVPTLPEVLGLYGFKTAAFTTDAPSGFNPDYGLDRGFQHMALGSAPGNTPDGRWSRKHTRQPTVEEGDGATAKPAVLWLEQQTTEQPVFLMMHTRTAHYPFVISQEGAAEDETGMVQALWMSGHEQTKRQVAGGEQFPGQQGGTVKQGVADIGGEDPVQLLVDRVGQPAVDVMRREYRRGVARTDVDIRKLIDAQRARGRADKTVWLLVADHGESLNDHGELLHGGGFYDTVINVPMLLRVPGMSGGGMVDSLVSHVDILPTLLELAGAPPPAGIDGASMLPLLRGETEQIRAMALSEGGVMLPNPKRLPGAVIAPPWTLLRHDSGCDLGASRTGQAATRGPPGCLFDMRSDPGQTTVVSAEHSAVVRELIGRWNSFRDTRSNEARQLELDPGFVDELQRTGYDFRAQVPVAP